MADTIRYEVSDNVAQIALDDGKVNAMALAFFAGLNAALDRAEHERPGALVIAGRAGVFSAGLDLKVLPTLAPDALERTMIAFGRTITATRSSGSRSWTTIRAGRSKTSAGLCAHRRGGRAQGLRLPASRTPYMVAICRERKPPSTSTRRTTSGSRRSLGASGERPPPWCARRSKNTRSDAIVGRLRAASAPGAAVGRS